MRFGFSTLAFLIAAALASAAQSPYENRIPDRKTFDRLQRTYYKGHFERIPHVLFLIDRATRKAYFAHSGSFDFHESFARSLGMGKGTSKEFFQRNYVDPDRPLIIGTLSRDPRRERFFFEYIEGDRVTAALVRETHERLKESFFAPVSFKPNSLAHDALRAGLGDAVPSLPIEEFARLDRTEVFFPGQATGILRFFPKSQVQQATWEENTLAVFEEAPIQVLPLRGIVTLEPSSPLSHVHMLARAWKVPDVRWKGAPHAELAGEWVTLIAKEGRAPVLRKATASEKSLELKKKPKPRAELPKPDLSYRAMPTLSEQRRTDSIRVGAKSANLGEVSRIKGVRVPEGFAVPFRYYERFFKAIGGEELARKTLSDPAFAQGGPDARKPALEKLRSAIQSGPMDEETKVAILKRYREVLKGAPVFVRSSTNAEDLPFFNGAGLYTSVPNVKEEAQLLEAVKTVWASLWNFEAFQAREAAGLDHFAAFAGVLIQRAMPAESAGVLITRNPYKRDDRRSVFINAKKGIGIKVVNGEKIPEQILYNAQTGAALFLSRSEESTYLSFDPKGGLVEKPLPEGSARVLTDKLVKDLARDATRIAARFKGVPQDIEWLVVDGQTWIVQSRPYLEN